MEMDVEVEVEVEIEKEDALPSRIPTQQDNFLRV